MNQMITQMVDILFQDVIDNEETRALHDELMNNCQEHYQDLVSSGMPEDEAAGAVMESLSGMQEVVDQYPRKEPAPAAEETEEAEEPADAEPEKCAVYSAEGIRKIHVDSGSFDVEVDSTSGRQISVSCGQMERLSVLQEDGVLRVQVVPAAEQIAEDVKKASESEASDRSFMDMTLNELLKKAKIFVDAAWKNISSHVNEQLFQADAVIRISVPEELLPVVEVNTGSGDVRVENMRASEYALRSGSGDITLDCSVKEAIDRIFASTASGDIRVGSAWAKEAEISAISGDVNLEGDYGALTCKSVSGDVDFEGTAVALNSKSVSGDVQLTLVQAVSGSICAEATSGDIQVNLPDDCSGVHLDAKSTAGDVLCELEDAGSSAPLQIRARTISGDIRISRG